MLKLGGSPIDLYWVAIFPMLLATFMNLYILNKFYYFPIMRYAVMVIGKNFLLVGVAALLPLLIQHNMNDGFLRFLLYAHLLLCVLLLCFGFWTQ